MKIGIDFFKEDKKKMWIFLPLLVHADPDISSVSGECSDGNRITINGVDFGSNGPNIAVFDDFEDGVNGQDIRIGAGSAAVGGWSDLGSNAPYYQNQHYVAH